MNVIGAVWFLVPASVGPVVLLVLCKGAIMILAVQHAVQVFANLVVASTMGLSLAIGVAGAFNQRFPLDCGTCQSGHFAVAAAAQLAPKLVLASAR